MTFPHARKGASKLFAAEIVQIIAFILLAVGGISLVFAIDLANSSDYNFGSVASMGLIAFIMFWVGVIMLAVVSILKLVGLWQAGKDEHHWLKTAFWLTVVQVVFIGGGTWLLYFNGGEFLGICFDDGDNYKFLVSAAELISLLAFAFTILGMSDLAKKVYRPGIASLGTVTLFMMVVELAAIAAAVWMADSTSVLLAIVALVCAIVVFILYLVFLAKAKNAFASS